MKLIEEAKFAAQEQMRQLDLAMEFIPETQHSHSTGECARSPLELYAECAAIYAWAARYLGGNPPKEWEEHMAKFQRVTAYGEAKPMMESALHEFCQALDSLEEARLDEIADVGFGLKMPIGRYILLPSYHTCYHVGQLNFIQTLLGDRDMHF